MNSYEARYASIWPAFSDVVFNILAILLFYVMLQYFMNQEQMSSVVIKARQSKMQSHIESVYYKYYSEPIENNIEFFINGNIQTLRFNNNVLFNTASIEIRPSGKKLFDVIVEALTTAPLDENCQFLYEWIMVEGFTDAIPISSSSLKNRGIETNWELSIMRAIKVVRYLQDKGIDPSTLSGSGYGQYRAKYSQKDPEELRARDRKLEISLVYRSVENIESETPVAIIE